MITQGDEYMGESQSRYSIVERLTSKKLSLIKEESELGSSVKEAERKVAGILVNKKAIDAERVADTVRADAEWDAKILAYKHDVEHAKEQESTRKDSIKKQLEAVDAALERIEAVSRESSSS